MKILGIQIGKLPENKVEEVTERKIVNYPVLQQKLRTREDIRKWESAIDIAEAVKSYNREDLNRIYRRILDDPILMSHWSTRQLKSLDKEFTMTRNGEVDEMATETMEAGWVMDYMKKMLDSKLFGFTLVEFGSIDDNKFINWKSNDGLIRDAVQVIDRDYVKPEMGIVVEQSGDVTGLDLTDDEVSKWTIFEGNSDYGLLRKMARYMLFKENVLGNWSEWSEVFGMDVRMGKTSTQGDDRNKFVKALRNLGANGFGVFDEDDVIENLGVSRQDAYKVYLEFAGYIDAAMAKLILGQDVISNNTGQVVGEIGENVSNLYGDTDAKFIARNINDKLIPKMIELGFKGLEGTMFEWDNTEHIDLVEKSQIDLRVSQMGYNLDQQYLEDTYGVTIDETDPKRLTQPIPKESFVNNVKEELKKLYG